MRRAMQGFTLTEILIVVIILGIMAAIAIPEFRSGPIEARRVNLYENLGKIRMQIALYRQQHNRYPEGARFEDQRTLFANQGGDTATSRSAEYRYPPYLEQMPTNPVTGLRTIRSTDDSAETVPDAAADGGWWYNESTGRFHADLTDVHLGPDGVPYCEY